MHLIEPARNRRAKQVKLTPKGVKAAATLAHSSREAEAEVAAGLGVNELEMLRSFLERAANLTEPHAVQ